MFTSALITHSDQVPVQPVALVATPRPPRVGPSSPWQVSTKDFQKFDVDLERPISRTGCTSCSSMPELVPKFRYWDGPSGVVEVLVIHVVWSFEQRSLWKAMFFPRPPDTSEILLHDFSKHCFIDKELSDFQTLVGTRQSACHKKGHPRPSTNGWGIRFQTLSQQFEGCCKDQCPADRIENGEDHRTTVMVRNVAGNNARKDREPACAPETSLTQRNLTGADICGPKQKGSRFRPTDNWDKSNTVLAFQEFLNLLEKCGLSDRRLAQLADQWGFGLSPQPQGGSFCGCSGFTFFYMPCKDRVAWAVEDAQTQHITVKLYMNILS